MDARSASVSPDAREAEVLHSKVSTAREKSERPGKASATFVEPQCKAPGNAVGGLPSPNAGLSWTALLNQLQVIRVDKSIIRHDVAHPPASVPPPPPALRTLSDENLSAGAGGGSEDTDKNAVENSIEGIPELVKNVPTTCPGVSIPPCPTLPAGSEEAAVVFVAATTWAS